MNKSDINLLKAFEDRLDSSTFEILHCFSRTWIDPSVIGYIEQYRECMDMFRCTFKDRIIYDLNNVCKDIEMHFDDITTSVKTRKLMSDEDFVNIKLVLMYFNQIVRSTVYDDYFTSVVIDKIYYNVSKQKVFPYIRDAFKKLDAEMLDKTSKYRNIIKYMRDGEDCEICIVNYLKTIGEWEDFDELDVIPLNQKDHTYVKDTLTELRAIIREYSKMMYIEDVPSNLMMIRELDELINRINNKERADLGDYFSMHSQIRLWDESYDRLTFYASNKNLSKFIKDSDMKIIMKWRRNNE